VSDPRSPTRPVYRQLRQARARDLGKTQLTSRSERGVVFFRDSEITPEEQKTLVQSLGLLGGKPKSHGLHIHPLTMGGSELGDEISVISNKFVFDDKFKRDDLTILDRVAHKTLWVSEVLRQGCLVFLLLRTFALLSPNLTVLRLHRRPSGYSVRANPSTPTSPSNPLRPTMLPSSFARYLPSAATPSGPRLTKPTTGFPPHTNVSSKA